MNKEADVNKIAASRKVSSRLLPCGRKLPAYEAFDPESEIADWRKRLKRYLENEGMKFSEQRWKVAQLILSGSRHFNAQQVVQWVQAHHSEIGPATVYRCLKVLLEANIIKETLTDSQGRTVYEVQQGSHHDHIVCLDCGHIFEFHDEGIEKLQTTAAKSMQFELTTHKHILYAHCEFLP